MMLKETIGFLGFGNMGQAIANGLIQTGTVNPESVLAFDMDPSKLQALVELGGRQVESTIEFAAACDVLVLATKPQDMDSALESVAPNLSADTLVVSIAAGLSIAYFKERLGNSTHIVRVMPNTPALAGAGAAAIALCNECTERDGEIADILFGAVGITERVDESAMDAVTALSGSGPAYYFYLVECFIRAGTMLGLTEEQATRLAVQTLYGSGKLLKESDDTVAELRAKVTSKGGTTHAALESFRAGGLEDLVYAATKSAADRSKELGK